MASHKAFTGTKCSYLCTVLLQALIYVLRRSVRYRSDVCTEHGLRRGRGAGTDLSIHWAKGETGHGAAGTGTSQGWRGVGPALPPAGTSRRVFASSWCKDGASQSPPELDRKPVVFLKSAELLQVEHLWEQVRYSGALYRSRGSCARACHTPGWSGPLAIPRVKWTSSLSFSSLWS